MPERMYDAVMVYHKALKITMDKNQDTRSGVTVMNNAKYLTIKSKYKIMGGGAHIKNIEFQFSRVVTKRNSSV